MFILNITFNCSDKSFLKWKSFLKDYFIPTSVKEGKFSKYKILKVLIEEEMGGQTYGVQLFAEEPQFIEVYMDGLFKELMNDLKKAFGEDVMVFPTVLKEETF